MTGDWIQPITAIGAAGVRDTWSNLADSREDAVQLFLDRMAEIVPGLEPGGLTRDHRPGAIAALSEAVAVLEDPEASAGPIASLSRIAAAAGVGPLHHSLITAALLWTLEDGLGEPLAQETRRAWASLCARITMHLASNLPSPQGD